MSVLQRSVAVRCGAVWELLPSVSKEHPQLEITYVSTIAPISKLRTLGAVPDVWLVDVGAATSSVPLTPALVYDLPKNYFADAAEAALLDD